MVTSTDRNSRSTGELVVYHSSAKPASCYRAYQPHFLKLCPGRHPFANGPVGPPWTAKFG